MADQEEIATWLSDLYRVEVDTQSDFTSKSLELFQQLGYKDQEFHFEVSHNPTNWPVHADYEIKSNSTAPTWIVVSTNYMYPDEGNTFEAHEFPGHRGEYAQMIKRGLTKMRDITDAEIAVSISNDHIAVLGTGTYIGDNLSSLSENQVQKIYDMLKHIGDLPTKDDFIDRKREFFTKTHAKREQDWVDISITTDQVNLDLTGFWKRLDAARKATSSIEKGETLEELATYLFSGFQALNVRETNYRTTSSELDLILERS